MPFALRDRVVRGSGAIIRVAVMLWNPIVLHRYVKDGSI